MCRSKQRIEFKPDDQQQHDQRICTNFTVAEVAEKVAVPTRQDAARNQLGRERVKGWPRGEDQSKSPLRPKTCRKRARLDLADPRHSRRDHSAASHTSASRRSMAPWPCYSER